MSQLDLEVPMGDAVCTLLLGMLIVPMLACGASESTDTTSEDSNATAAAPAETEGAFFADDFSDSGSGWARSDEDYQTTDYADGAYTIRFKDTNLLTHVDCPCGEHENAIVEADVWRVEGSGGWFGLYARYDGDSFVRCVLSENGQVAVDVAPYEGYSLPPPVFEQHSAVNSDAMNRLSLSVSGTKVACSVNGVVIKSIEQNPSTGGELGFMATSDSERTETRFDNFTVTTP